MALLVTCNHCSVALKVSEKLAGKRGKCPKCGQTLQIPLAPEAPSQPPTPSHRVAPPQLATPSESPATGSLQQQVLGAFEGNVLPVRRPLSYRISIGLAALVTVILPLVYMGLIGLVAFGVYLHAVHNVGMLNTSARGNGYFLILITYLAPMAIGTIVTVFMIKPLFARPAHAHRTRSLTRSGEPLLFAFVDRICEAVRAPRPTRIDVNDAINASAKLRRGLLSFFGNDLVLTIGVPLVLGMNTRQFGGILAHEFGHFSQGAGMRLSYVIRVISAWFARVVYERDQWDEWLHATARSIDLRVGWVLFVAEAVVWLTRKILWLLMNAGIAVAGMLMRDMEFDADRYEARLAGSDQFADTTRRLIELTVAHQRALETLNRFSRDGRLVDNIPRLAVVTRERLPAEVIEQVHQEEMAARTSWLNSHPCTADRIASAAREQTPGIFRLELPAASLLRDAEDLARKVTLDFYRGVFGVEMKSSALIPIDQLLGSDDQEAAASAALDRLMHGHFQSYRKVAIAPAPPKGDCDELTEAMRSAAVAVESLAAAYGELVEKCDNARTRLIEADVYLAYIDAGLKVDTTTFQIEVNDSASARKVADEARDEIAAIEKEMAPFEAAVAAQLNAGIGRLFASPRDSAEKRIAEARQRCRRLFPAWHAFQSAFEYRDKLYFQIIRLYAVARYMEGRQTDDVFLRELQKQVNSTAETVNALRSKIGDVPYPFNHAVKDMSVRKFVSPEPVLDKDDPSEVYRCAVAVLHAFDDLRLRILAHLVHCVEFSPARS